jgi:putative flippase GtrA
MKHRFYHRRFFDSKAIKFLGAGILNTVFGYSVFAILLFIKFPYLIALFIANIAGVVFNYKSFGRIVFDDHGNLWIFGRFVIAYILIYITNAVLLRIWVVDFLLNPYFGQVLCIPISVLSSWFLMNYWVYKND